MTGGGVAGVTVLDDLDDVFDEVFTKSASAFSCKARRYSCGNTLKNK